MRKTKQKTSIGAGKKRRNRHQYSDDSKHAYTDTDMELPRSFKFIQMLPSCFVFLFFSLEEREGGGEVSKRCVRPSRVTARTGWPGVGIP